MESPFLSVARCAAGSLDSRAAEPPLPSTASPTLLPSPQATAAAAAAAAAVAAATTGEEDQLRGCFLADAHDVAGAGGGDGWARSDGPVKVE